MNFYGRGHFLALNSCYAPPKIDYTSKVQKTIKLIKILANTLFRGHS
jgi:hypothetical protein